MLYDKKFVTLVASIEGGDEPGFYPSQSKQLA